MRKNQVLGCTPLQKGIGPPSGPGQSFKSTGSPFLTSPNNTVQTSTDVGSTPKIRETPHYGRLMPGVPTSKCEEMNAGRTTADVGKTPKMRGGGSVWHTDVVQTYMQTHTRHPPGGRGTWCGGGRVQGRAGGITGRDGGRGHTRERGAVRGRAS